MTKEKKFFFEQAQGACKRGTAAMLCIILVLVASSCVKQRNCDCDYMATGKFVYLKEPYKMWSVPCNTQGKITAHFIENQYSMPLSGYVPIKYRSTDTIEVSICWEQAAAFCTAEAGPDYYKLKCIERR
jgi:hypothetical protein